MSNNKEKENSLKNEIEYEISKMSLEELIYLELNSNMYIYKKLSPKIEQLKKLGNEINSMEEEFNLLKFQKNDFDNNIKEQIENNSTLINKLLEEKKILDSKVTKNEFIKLLNDELKNFDNPESCFNRFKDGIIDYNEFKRQYLKLGKDKNYYYYKLISDIINS